MLAFLEDGGYRRHELWLSLGWDRVQAEGWSAPLYWRKQDGRWWRFSLHGLLPLDPHEPAAHLSLFEADAYAPYPGFRPWEGALGEYNGKFMCNQDVLRGGSCLTPDDHIRTTYRYFFPPEARWQMTGLRLARRPGGSTSSDMHECATG